MKAGESLYVCRGQRSPYDLNEIIYSAARISRINGLVDLRWHSK